VVIAPTEGSVSYQQSTNHLFHPTLSLLRWAIVKRFFLSKIMRKHKSRLLRDG
jgi:hypothetical protein